ncbi:MAG: bifunctional glutamate N-acetyltransferase/amino-acid acetyltransferase ArgJ, partial [Clostridia bacterium]|nr:bifunctional glutamate N-acetyltransferase/amino-acid acetyltransferase ArgJ [Clostridia bacterium]
SGNANTCNANGIEIAEGMANAVASALAIAPTDVVVASTGVIGQPLDLSPIVSAMPMLCEGLSATGSAAAAEGIMTTDTVKKEIAVEFTLGGKTCRIGGIAKGSGMIHPNMATMLVFITTDVSIASEMLAKALSTDIASTFNMVSVDGDTSTNDMVTVLANGMAENPEITEEGEDFTVFMKALNTVTVSLCRMIAGDGEGATKLLECSVSGAKDEKTAKTIAKSVICSSLLKAAMFGADANWGRVLCAIGYSGADCDVNGVGVTFTSAKGSITVCENGAGIAFSEEKAKEILLEKEIEIVITLKDGDASAVAWGCDLTYDYVKINGDYRT